MKWIGLTGGIATGKSTVKKLAEGLGIPTIDADMISHQVTEKGQKGYDQVVSHFGKSFLNADLTLNRKQLGAVIFSDPLKRIELESILHPLIKEQVTALKKQYLNESQKYCIYDVPLLFEKNMQNDFDLTVLVWCDPQTQLQRLMTRNQYTQEQALLRVQSQMKMIDKVKLANYCLDNSTSLESLAIQFRNLLAKI